MKKLIVINLLIISTFFFTNANLADAKTQKSEIKKCINVITHLEKNCKNKYLKIENKIKEDTKTNVNKSKENKTK